MSDEQVIKILDEITLAEWSGWEWIDVTAENEKRRHYARGKQRAPADSIRARQEFLEYLKHKTEVLIP